MGDRIAAVARRAFITSMRVVYVTAAWWCCAAFVAWRFLPARAPTDEVLFDEEVELAEALSVTDT